MRHWQVKEVHGFKLRDRIAVSRDTWIQAREIATIFYQCDWDQVLMQEIGDRDPVDFWIHPNNDGLYALHSPEMMERLK